MGLGIDSGNGVFFGVVSKNTQVRLELYILNQLYSELHRPYVTHYYKKPIYLAAIERAFPFLHVHMAISVVCCRIGI